MRMKASFTDGWVDDFINFTPAKSPHSDLRISAFEFQKDSYTHTHTRAQAKLLLFIKPGSCVYSQTQNKQGCFFVNENQKQPLNVRGYRSTHTHTFTHFHSPFSASATEFCARVFILNFFLVSSAAVSVLHSATLLPHTRASDPPLSSRCQHQTGRLH